MAARSHRLPHTANHGPAVTALPKFVRHVSLTDRGAERLYGGPPKPADGELGYMPEEVTCDHARRMHYAACRAYAARTRERVKHWVGRYYDLRDAIVLGNQKLIFRAVRGKTALANRADDLIGDCHVVLIQAVAAYNPWLGVRFSTYAYTCLLRALARQARRLASDWLSRSLPLDMLADGAPGGRTEEATRPGFPPIDLFLRDDHPLLSQREKAILTRRYNLAEAAGVQTLDRVGRELGLSKERVRQVQTTALGKLRQALLEHGMMC